MRRRRPPRFAAGRDHLPRWHPSTLAAAWWAWRAIRAARAGYATRSVHDVTVPPPPAWLPDEAATGVRGVLSRTGQRCLVRATVLQAWESAHGRDRAMIIGVTRPGSGFRAHAWLDGEPPCRHEGYEELLRR